MIQRAEIHHPQRDAVKSDADLMTRIGKRIQDSLQSKLERGRSHCSDVWVWKLQWNGHRTGDDRSEEILFVAVQQIRKVNAPVFDLNGAGEIRRRETINS